jgi:exosortase family protein XrtG
MTKYLILIPVLIIWLYLLHVCAKAKLPFWHFFIGSVGLFILLVIYARPVLTDPMARAVAEIASIFGSITGVFRANFKYGVILIGNAKEVISMQIDFECSGILEMIVFVSVMAFFKVYTVLERIIVGILGVAYIMLTNVVRIIIICYVVHFFGPDSFNVAHTLIGRIFFYGASVILYFLVFTKAQIKRQKVGSFGYNADNQ